MGAFIWKDHPEIEKWLYDVRFKVTPPYTYSQCLQDLKERWPGECKDLTLHAVRSKGGRMLRAKKTSGEITVKKVTAVDNDIDPVTPKESWSEKADDFVSEKLKLGWDAKFVAASLVEAGLRKTASVSAVKKRMYLIANGKLPPRIGKVPLRVGITRPSKLPRRPTHVRIHTSPNSYTTYWREDLVLTKKDFIRYINTVKRSFGFK